MSTHADKPSKRKASHLSDNFAKRFKHVGHLYPQPVDGNKIFSSEEARYGRITEVQLGSPVVPFKSMLLTDALPDLHMDDPCYAVEHISFTLGDVALVPGSFRTATEQLPTEFSRCAASIVELTRKVCYPDQPVFAFAAREAQVDSGDSDDEAPKDGKVESPWTSTEAAHINNVLLKNYWCSFTHAQDRSFQHAVGKFFLENYFKHCVHASWIVIFRYSTAPTPTAKISQGLLVWGGVYENQFF
jgi:hypothetical protein